MFIYTFVTQVKYGLSAAMQGNRSSDRILSRALIQLSNDIVWGIYFMLELNCFLKLTVLLLLLLVNSGLVAVILTYA